MCFEPQRQSALDCYPGNARRANSLTLMHRSIHRRIAGRPHDSRTQGDSWTSPTRSASSDSPTTTSCCCPGTPTSSPARPTPRSRLTRRIDVATPAAVRRDGHRDRVAHGDRHGPPGRHRHPAPQPLDRRPGRAWSTTSSAASRAWSPTRSRRRPTRPSPRSTRLCGQLRVSRPAGRRRRRHARRHHHQPRHALRLRLREADDARARRHDARCRSSPGRVGIDPDEAIAIFAQHKIEKLPLVDGAGRLTGLITVKDFDKTEQYPNATKDAEGRLRVGAAIGFFGDAWERAEAAARRRRRRDRRRHRERRQPPACSTSSAASRPTRPSRTSTSSAATSRPARARRRSSMPAPTPSRSASAPARSAPRASSPASACRR